LARVEKPLMAQRATGKLGDALIYEVWHGINYVKRNTPPTNPNTTDQQTQRGYYGEAIEIYRASQMTKEDKRAWDVVARQLGGGMSGYNAWMKECMFNLKKGWPFKDLHNGTIDQVSGNYITFGVHCVTGQTIHAFLYTRGFSLIEYHAMSEVAPGEYEYDFGSFPSGRMYFRAEILIPFSQGETGFYLCIN
jgi:hypothetical protein